VIYGVFHVTEETMKLGVTAALAFLSLSALAVGGVQAQQPAAPAPHAGAAPPAGGPAAPAAGKPQAWQQACQPEIEKVCKEVATKGGNVPDCLAAHEKDLSEQCTHIFLWRYRVMQDCKDDLQKLCGDKLASGATTAAQCFKENEKALSEKCRTALIKGSKRQKAEDKGKTVTDADEKAETPAKPAKRSKKK
jgi:hypothetical protein